MKIIREDVIAGFTIESALEKGAFFFE